MGVEATYWGKTSVLLGKSLYMNMGACHQPASHEEAIEMLERPELPRLDRINAIKYGYWEIAKGIPFEVCQQKSLFDFHVNGTPLKPALGWMLLEKITKLTKLKNRRFLDDVRKKVKGWLS
ncbi:MAG TPA: hypothetical protein PKK99_06990 [Bacteroidia bacterium]|nr:hypothetical protein [Bacteroidia bacterium]